MPLYRSRRIFAKERESFYEKFLQSNILERTSSLLQEFTCSPRVIGVPRFNPCVTREMELNVNF